MNETILLVEDEDNDVFFMKRAMKKAGLNCPHVVTNGQCAIDYLKEAIYADTAKLPGLVLLDLKLPRIMGLEVLSWIRDQSELREMVVIVLTSSKLKSDIEAANERGADSYLVKPNNCTALQKLIEKIKDCWMDDRGLSSRMLKELSET